jgi:hypothetical protein
MDTLFPGSPGIWGHRNIVYQDNKSAILMEKNGKASSSKRTKHINIRYYFVTDRINKKDLTAKWYPTGNIIGDFITKLNQGALFKTFREQIMGVTPTKTPGPGKVKDKIPFTHKSLVKRGELDHRSVLDGYRKLTKNGQHTDITRPKKNLWAKKNINNTYARHEGAKQRIST